MDPALSDRILSRYPHASGFQRWHMRTRLRLCPYDALLKHLTGPDSLLDVGCGFGHLAWYLADRHPGLRYYGTDIDERKIALAQGCPRPAVTAPAFQQGDARALPGLPERFGNIVFLDVLYLMPWDLQRDMVVWALDRLAPGPDSVLVIKTMDPPEGFSGLRAVAEEWVMVRLLRRTRDSGTLNGARPWDDYAKLAAARGFRCEREALGTFNPSTLLAFRRAAQPAA